MMQDNSHEFDDTWNFLDRQLACCVQIGQCASAVMTIFFRQQVILKISQHKKPLRNETLRDFNFR